MQFHHYQLLSSASKPNLLNKINVIKTLNFSTLLHQYLQPHDPHIPPIIEQRRELANLLQLPSHNIPIPCCKKIHAKIVVCGFHQHDIFLVNTLLHSYTHHSYVEALMLFVQFMRSCNEKPKEHILASVVKALARNLVVSTKLYRYMVWLLSVDMFKMWLGVTL